MRVFHYTVVNFLPAIFERKMLMPTAKAVREEQAVWFSTNPEWEESANKAYHSGDGIPIEGTKWDTYKIYGGLSRIEVSPDIATCNWEQYKKKSKISDEKSQEIEGLAAKCNADTKEWRASFEPVHKDNFISVEVLDWDRQVWEDYMVAYDKAKKEIEAHHSN